jgi:hypothetical protein
MLSIGLASVQQEKKERKNQCTPKIATDTMRQSRNAKETMLSEILQGCFSKIGNSSLQLIYHMAVPEQPNKEKERREGKVMDVKLKQFAFLFVQVQVLRICQSEVTVLDHAGTMTIHLHLGHLDHEVR